MRTPAHSPFCGLWSLGWNLSTWCVVVVSSFGSSCSWMKSSSLRVKVLSLGVSPSPSMEIATAAIAVGSRALLRHDCLRGPLVVSRLATTSALPLALPFLPQGDGPSSWVFSTGVCRSDGLRVSTRGTPPLPLAFCGFWRGGMDDSGIYSDSRFLPVWAKNTLEQQRREAENERQSLYGASSYISLAEWKRTSGYYDAYEDYDDYSVGSDVNDRDDCRTPPVEHLLRTPRITDHPSPTSFLPELVDELLLRPRTHPAVAVDDHKVTISQVICHPPALRAYAREHQSTCAPAATERALTERMRAHSTSAAGSFH